MNLMEFLKQVMKEKGMTMTDLEVKVKGKRTGQLKNQIEFNFEKLNKILNEVGLEISLKHLFLGGVHEWGNRSGGNEYTYHSSAL